MRVLTLTTLFPNRLQPNLGVFVRNRIQALSGYAEVRVVAPVPWVPRWAKGPKAELFRVVPASERIAGLATYHPRYLVIPKVLRPLYGDLYFWSVASFLQTLRVQFPFEVLDVHWAYPDGYAGVALGKLLQVPVCVSLRGSDIHTYTKNRTLKKLIGQTLRRADLVIPVARSMVPLVEELGVSRERVLVVPNGVDGELFCLGDKGKARAELGLEGGGTVILAVGRLEKPKRLDLLIEACARLREKGGTDLLLVIVGNGTLREELMRLAKARGMTEHVVFAGEVANRDLASWYRAADFFCLASDNEGCPNVLLEAAACGVPVIASNVGGVPEFVSPENGQVVAENTAQAWCATLRAAIERRWAPGQVEGTVRGRTWDEIGRRVFEGLCACRENYGADRFPAYRPFML